MKQVSGKAFAKLLSQKGWELKRIHGSHHVYTKAGRKERISLLVHGNKPLKNRPAEIPDENSRYKRNGIIMG